MSGGYTLPWYTGPSTAFDLESTGKYAKTDRIVTGFVATVGPVGQRNWTTGANVLINPGVPIHPEAAAVHGVTDEVAQAKGLDPRDGVNSIAEALAQSLKARIPIVGFNLAFDCTMLHYECLRWDLPTVSERIGLPPGRPYGPIIDAHVLDKAMDPYRPGSRTLDDRKGPGTGVAAHYGVPLGANAHRADADAMAAVRVAVRIGQKFVPSGQLPADPVALHAAQKGWRAEQAAGLQAYFRGKGRKPEAVVDPCWPICLDDTHATG